MKLSRPRKLIYHMSCGIASLMNRAGVEDYRISPGIVSFID